MLHSLINEPKYQTLKLKNFIYVVHTIQNKKKIY